MDGELEVIWRVLRDKKQRIYESLPSQQVLQVDIAVLQ